MDAPILSAIPGPRDAQILAPGGALPAAGRVSTPRPGQRFPLHPPVADLIAAPSGPELLGRGDALILALSGDRLVHVRWLAFQPLAIPEAGAFLRLGAGETYAHNAFTFPAWRGHGLLPAVRSRCFHYLRERGCTREILYVDACNAASLRAQEKLGSRRARKGRRHSRGAGGAGDPSDGAAHLRLESFVISAGAATLVV